MIAHDRGRYCKIKKKTSLEHRLIPKNRKSVLEEILIFVNKTCSYMQNRTINVLQGKSMYYTNNH